MIFPFSFLDKVDPEKWYAIIASDKETVIGFIIGEIVSKIKDERYSNYYLCEIRSQDAQGILENL
jgi:hypothetical protein